MNAALCALVPAERAVGGDSSITSGAAGGLGGSFPLQAASLCPSHPHIPHVPVGMAAGLGKELWDSARVGSLAHIFLVPDHHYKGGKRKCLDLRGSCESFLLSSSPHLLSSFCFSLLHRHLLTLSLSPVQDSPTGAGAEGLGQQELT